MPEGYVCPSFKMNYMICNNPLLILQAASIKREMTFTAFQQEDLKSNLNHKLSDQHFFLLATKEEDSKTADTKKPGRVHEHEKESTCSVCLLEQKRKVVSSNIDVPPAR